MKATGDSKAKKAGSRCQQPGVTFKEKMSLKLANHRAHLETASTGAQIPAVREKGVARKENIGNTDSFKRYGR